MNRKFVCSLAAGAALAAPLTMLGDAATPSPLQSQVQTHLRLDLKDDVKEVHFVNTNNDPWVYTKVYMLKNTDPYEVRPYLVNAIGGFYDVTNVANNEYGRRVNASTTKVECVKYMDGVGALIVSAEDYRFTDSGKENSMSIDEIVAILDQKGMIYNNNQSYMLYFPKYWDADSLSTVIQRSGMNVANDQWELQGGQDSVRVDQSLNGLLLYYPTYSKKQFEQMLALYDRPSPEALISYTVYELSKENDSQIGSDFQNWLNGPGSDLVSAGMTSARNWDATQMAPVTKAGSSSTKFFNFSPKWSTKYLDFLASKSMAQVVTSGSLSIMNSSTGYVGSTTQLPTIVTGAVRSNGGITGSRYVQNAAIGTGVSFGSMATDKNVALADLGASAGTITIVEGQESKYDGNGNNEISYVYLITVVGGGNISDANGKSLGPKVRAYSSSQSTVTISGVAASWTTGSATDTAYAPFAVQKAPKRNTSIQTIVTSGDTYGFEMTLSPTVNEDASTINVAVVNTNMVGMKSDGTVRLSRSEFGTQVSVGNKGEKFVIGGIDKDQVLRSENGLPWLNNIPGLGWAFSSERESHKKSQLVAVIECVPVMPEVAVPAGIMSDISANKTKIENYGTKCGVIDENDFGFEQFLLDVDKKSLDPLP